DGPQTPKGRIVAVESLVRRRVNQGGVLNPVPQKYCSLHDFPPKKVRKTEVRQQESNNDRESTADSFVGFSLLTSVGGNELKFHADFATVRSERQSRVLCDFIRFEVL
ncbi:MAG: hypothetical protein ABJZ69_12585, partial [Hyphomicrobiales bacterium]